MQNETTGTFTLHIDKIAAGGAGLGTADGLKVFVPMTAPGDTIRCRFTRRHKNWAEAELITLEQGSPDRAEPLCPLYGVCGGCSLQHLSYPAQLDAKKLILEEAFTRIGGFGRAALPHIGVYPSPPAGYRNRMQLHRMGRLPGAARCGLKARRGAVIVPLADCPAADPAIRRALADSASGDGPLASAAANRFTVYGRADNGGSGDLLLVEGSPVHRGKTVIAGREFTLDAGVFFQSNAAMLEKLLERLTSVIGGGAGPAPDRSLPAADIYSGVGVFAAFLAERFPRVDLAEINAAAVSLAKENVTSRNAGFFALSGDDWAAKNSGGYGFAVADPPREGFSAALRQWFIDKGPPLLAYVSCEAAALARDAAALCGNGGTGPYRLVSLDFFDFYPQTAHVECLALFARG